MNVLTMIILTLFTAALTYYLIMLTLRIRLNYLSGRGLRDSLQLEIANLRLGRMIDALGISKSKYTHQESVLDISHHISKCKSCENTSECDERLDSNNIIPEALQFCANEKSLLDIADKQD